MASGGLMCVKRAGTALRIDPAQGSPAVTRHHRGMLLANPAIAEEECFHCALPIPADARFAYDAHGTWRCFCCAGCEAISRAIADGGLDDYYRLRTTPAARAPETAADDLAIYDDPAIQQRFVRTLPDGTRELELVIEGMRCAACAWLLERSIARVPGVRDVVVNATTHRALVTTATTGDRPLLSSFEPRGSHADNSGLSP